jgi:serine/threonine-protein kinase
VIGKSLSHYRLVEKIGEGGMGVVWKAHDSKLDRDVAVKILPAEFSQDKQRLARFEREAKLLAALNHPNIAAIYGFDNADGVHFLVLELVDGQTLAQTTKAGPLPVEEALDVCRQVAEGLEAAHDAGVIHRDLKPGNIIVTHDGKAKVLDFGLAKELGGEGAGNASGGSASDLSHSPTVTAGTQAGVILGTAPYMSPEQARGKPVDRRADIWSFGCVLYEALTGKHCFGGETRSDTLAHILEREPDWTAVPPGTPAAIRALLDRCLRKDSRRRLRDIGEARIAIEELHADETMEVEKVPRRSWRSVLPWVVAALMAVCAGIAFWSAQRPASPLPRSFARLTVSLPRQQQLAVGHAASLAVSPDGSRLAYAAASPPGSRPSLHLRALDRFEAIRIPGTDGAIGPFFSPDGQWLGYFAENKLFKVPVGGGTRFEICDVGQVVPGASWGPDDTILFSRAPESGLVRVPAEGGEPEELTTPDFANGETGHGWPQLLPDGESLLFTIASVDGPRIAVLSLRTGRWRTLVRGIGGARYLPTGHLVYPGPGGLLAVPFDPVQLQMDGSPALILEDVYTIPGVRGFGLAAYAVSDTGLLVYAPGGAAAGENMLVWVDRDGRTKPLTGESGSYEWPRLSPDGKKVAVADRSEDGKIDIWVLDIEREARSRLTLDGTNITPCWTPDGEQIAFGSLRRSSGVVELFWKSADGSGQARRLLGGKHPRFPRSWSPDGTVLAITEWNPESQRDVWVLALDDPPAAEPVLVTQFNEYSPIFSPDGRWLAYVSDESGREEVYVQPYPGGRGRWLISAGGGGEPVWSASGHELFYRNANAMMVVSIRTEPVFSAGKPRLVFQGQLKPGIYGSLSYDVSADGRHFLMIESDREVAPNRLNVVLDWREELRNKAPVNPN